MTPDLQGKVILITGASRGIGRAVAVAAASAGAEIIITGRTMGALEESDDAIKAAGGVALIQDPQTAKYDGMPRAAIQTGSADMVLPAQKVGDVLLGLIAGYVGGWLDTLIMRLADIQMTFPSILIAMLIFGVARGLLPADLREEMAITVLILSIGLSEWVNFARTVRGSTMVEKEKEYVAAARLIGLNRWQIMLRHILPNVLGPVLVIATITLALAIIAEATLSFLGVGAPRTEPSLGTLIRIGQDFLFSGEWWILLFPALTLLALALSVNLFGDWLRDTLNPRLR